VPSLNAITEPAVSSLTYIICPGCAALGKEATTKLSPVGPNISDMYSKSPIAGTVPASLTAP